MGGDNAIIVNEAGAEGGAFRRKETPGCVANRSAASGGAAERVRVLLIEDDASINEIVGDHLERCGYACVRAFSGTEAQLLLERERFDLVVTDLMLPGLAGESLVALIRASDATMPIIVVSARTAPADKIDLLKLGADGGGRVGRCRGRPPAARRSLAGRPGRSYAGSRRPGCGPHAY